MKLGLNSAALSRIASAIRHGQAAEQQLDWRDLQDLSMEITAAVEQQDLRRLMEAVEDMTSLMLSHIQMPEGTDVSQAFPRTAYSDSKDHTKYWVYVNYKYDPSKGGKGGYNFDTTADLNEAYALAEDFKKELPDEWESIHIFYGGEDGAFTDIDPVESFYADEGR